MDRFVERVLADPWTERAAKYVGWAFQAFLLGWFAWQTWMRLSLFFRLNFPIGIDARIYYRGVAAWLDGSNPWDAAVTVGGAAYHYAGSPVTTILLAWSALFSEDVFTVLWLGLSLGAAVFTLHRVHLPIWWLLFPPISEALFSGNPQLVVLALILCNSSWLAAIGTGLKVYAFIPLAGEGRWRTIGLAVLLNAATFLIAPDLWFRYIDEFSQISSRLQYESIEGFSAFYFPMLLAVTVVALAILALRDRRAAGWLTVPAIWPASQLHYSTMALPVMSPFLAVFLAVPLLRLPPQIIIVEVVRRLIAPSVTGYIARHRIRGGPAGESAPTAEQAT